ncbi:hypothetical protein [Aureimonas ureilytica]|uniref:hypothetical protein n=1 Tax=Aureimonas ureilytica TaxID=401562 RepID=UPI00128F8510|nr:hypothetical protein [Aureimonas ureilytica]
MTETSQTPSSIGSLIASRRRRRDDAPGRASAADTSLRVRFVRSSETVLEGYVIDPVDPERRLAVELLLDGYPAQLMRAQLLDREALALGRGDGCHGFRFVLEAGALAGLGRAELRLANLDIALGEPIDLRAATGFDPSGAPSAGAQWDGGLTVSGWLDINPTSVAPRHVEAVVDGAVVARTVADRWRKVTAGNAARPVAGFRLTLPRSLADGHPRDVELLADGRPLPVGPLTLVAFPDGLAADLKARAEYEQDVPRGALFDAILPDHVPFTLFEDWDRRFPLVTASEPGNSRVAVLVVGAGDGEASLAALGDHPGGPMAILAPFETSGGFDPAAARLFLETEAADCDAILWLRAGARLRPGALSRWQAALEADPAASLCYGDLLLQAEDGTLQPLALPAFDYERALEQSLFETAFLMRRDEAMDALARGVAHLHRLFLAPIEAGLHRLGRFLHVPGLAAICPIPSPRAEAETLAASVSSHLSARGVAADLRPRPAMTLPALRVRRKAAPATIALILDADDPSLPLREAGEALRPARRAGDVQLFVSAGILDPSLREALRLDGIELLQSSGGRSRAARLNAAVEAAPADLVCILDARLRPVGADWLDELTSRIAETDVGAVAPVLLGGDGAVAEAGRILSPLGHSLPAFEGMASGDPAYGDALTVARQTSGLSWSAVLTRRAEFLALGGFDALLFPHRFGAQDYALKLQAFGRRVVQSPDAVLKLSAPPLTLPGDGSREARALLARWPGVAASDPFHSPLLPRGGSLHAGLAWPPGSLAPRRSQVAPARAVPPGWW